MSEPKRWVDEGPSEAVERLLHAASAERPSEVSLSRALTALGLGAGTTGAAATAGAATTAGAASSAGAGTAAASGAAVISAGKATSVLTAGALVKWGLVGGALALASFGGATAFRRGTVHADAVSPPTASARKTTPNADVTKPNAAVPSPNAAVTSPNGAVTPAQPQGTVASPSSIRTATPAVVAAALPSAKPTRPAGTRSTRGALVRGVAAPAASEAAAPIDAERLAEEVALVDTARGALARGDARGTLAALDDYEARFSRRKFAPEALYLRMEALLRLGRTSEAQDVAARLATTYPSSPNAARARQVLAPTIP